MAYFTPYAGTGDASLTAALSPASGITILPGSIALTYQVLDGQGGATIAKQMFVVLPKLDQEATGSLAISGTVQEGATITADTTGITDADGSFSTAFQWQLRNDSGSAWTDIAGAAAATLAIPGDQGYVGRCLRVTAITTDAHGGTTAFTSAPQTVANVNDAPIGGVAIGGTVAEGQTLTASSSIIDEDGLDPATILYRWQADGADLPAATGASVLLAAADAGKAITVVASYVDAMGTPEQVTSDAVGFGLTLSGTRRADLLTGSA